MTSVRVCVVLLLLGLGTSPARGQDRQEAAPQVPKGVVQRVEGAFANGDAQRLLTPAADRVEVSLLGTRTYYSSAQAFYVLRDFFEAHPPTTFTLTDATEAEESCFLRGRLSHARGDQTLQVYVRLVRRQENWQLQEVRVDSEIE